jgi:hypothetical protein
MIEQQTSIASAENTLKRRIPGLPRRERQTIMDG